MRYSLFIILIIVVSSGEVTSQTRAELEERRKNTLEEISYVDNLLKTTAKQRTAGVNELKIIQSRIGMRESVIVGLRNEMELYRFRIELNTISISMMDEDIVILKMEYASNIRMALRASKGFHPAIYILSARDFNQGYKRMKYIQQSARFRKRQAEIIADLVTQVEDSKNRLEADLSKIDELAQREESQKKVLETEQQRKQRLIRELSGKERQLRADLENKRKIAARIQTEIKKLIEEEKKKASATDLTPEQRLISDNFVENKGRLPWPVERGVVTSKFGKHRHPALKNVTEDNPGIEITSSGNTPVRTVFNGEIVSVVGISGANMAIIVKHGKYFTVYQNVINVRVKPGDKVVTKQVIGELFIEKETGNKGVLMFMIYEATQKLNPEIWISQK